MLSPVPYTVFESEMARKELATKRWFTAWLITFLVLVAFAAGVIWYESQWIVEETTVTQDAEWDSGDVIMNGTGEVTINGQSETDDYDTAQSTEDGR